MIEYTRSNICTLSGFLFKETDYTNRSSISFYNGNNYSDYLLAFLHIQSLLKKGLLQKERIYSLGEQIILF